MAVEKANHATLIVPVTVMRQRPAGLTELNCASR